MLNRVYCLMVEDPWDEYYEKKLHAVYSSEARASHAAANIAGHPETTSIKVMVLNKDKE